VRFAFIHHNRERYDLNVMLRVLNVSRSGYYFWIKRPPSQREHDDARILEKIKTIHQGRKRSYGSPRVHACLLGMDERLSLHRTARIMRENGIRAQAKRKFKRTRDSNHEHPLAENILAREFDAAKPNQKWVSDITYLSTAEGWLYLAVVIDLFSRMVVGYAMGDSLETGLVLGAFGMARAWRKPAPGLLCHSDRGVQYASVAFRRELSVVGAVQSMSRKGDCWDNAVVESFFGSLKTELEGELPFGSRAQARAVVFEWINVFYNRERLHSKLGFRSPAVFEEVVQGVLY